MTKPALCQCVHCFRYLARNRTRDDFTGLCTMCTPRGIPLAQIRGTLSDDLSIEVLALLSEECGEVVQRNGKINRWGWNADFEGTTQQHKLETELGDVLAATAIAAYNGKVTVEGVVRAMKDKIAKLVEDAEGPRQRLLHARVPHETWFPIGLVQEMLRQGDYGERNYLVENVLRGFCRGCGDEDSGCPCENDE